MDKKTRAYLHRVFFMWDERGLRQSMEADSVFSYLLFSKFLTFKGKRKDVNGYIQYIVNISIFI